MQFAGSVNTQIVGNPVAGVPIVGAVDPLWFANVLGTPVDTGATCFPTVPASFDANRKYYPGLSRSYIQYASLLETPTHRQIQYASQDIPSIQLTVRRGLSPEVLARWQLANTQMADPRFYSTG
jgi:hypothetical protein